MRNRRIIPVILLILLLIPSFSLAGSIRDFLFSLADGPAAYTAEISGQFRTCVPYSDERLGHFNDLLKHLRLKIAQGDGISAVGLLADGKEAFSVCEAGDGEQYRTVFSFDPGTAYLSGDSFLQGNAVSVPVPGCEESGISTLAGKLKPDHLQLADDAAVLFRGLPEKFAGHAKTVAVKTKINDFGTARQRTVITLTKQEVEEGALNLLAGDCENTVLREWLSGLMFSGRQQAVCFLDEQGKMIRFQYSGQAGTEERPRKVTLEWKMLRSEERIRDEITLKAPAVSGTDKINLTFLREENTGDEETKPSLQISFTYKETRNKVKTAAEGSVLLEKDGEKILGSAEIQLGAGKTGRRKILLETATEDGPERKGSLRCAFYLDHAEQVDLMLDFSVVHGSAPVFPETGTETSLQAIGPRKRAAVLSSLEQKTAASLIRALLALPEEDLLFLNDELDAGAWLRIRQVADSSSEGGTHP